MSRAMAAGIAVEELFVCRDLAGAGAGADAAGVAAEHAAAAGSEVIEVNEAVLRKMSYHREPEGLLAVCVRPGTGLDRLPAVNDGTLWLVAVGTEKPGNLGAMARTADAAGCSAVIAAGTPVDPFHPNALRASTGAVFALPVVTCGEDEARAALRERGVRLLAAAVDGAVAWDDADVGGAVAIAIGAEDAGLSPAWGEAAAASGGATLRIDAAGRVVDSLNASVAAGVLLFESVRRRRISGTMPD